MRKHEVAYEPRHGQGRYQYFRRFAAGCAVFVTAMAFVTFFVIFGESIRFHVLSTTRGLTGATDRGMTVAAWTLVMVPLWLGIAGALASARLPGRVTIAWLAMCGITLVVLVFPFMPGKGVSLDDVILGPGAAGFRTGLRWSGAAIGAGFVSGVLFNAARGDRMIEPWMRLAATLGGLALALGALGLALARVS